jgi:DNA helicase-2/ATP-dependent DNA helicase PcrA
MVEGILPRKKGDLEEERRICFVGMSRAMKLLYLCRSISYFGQGSKRSLFLEEITNTDELPQHEIST